MFQSRCVLAIVSRIEFLQNAKQFNGAYGCGWCLQVSRVQGSQFLTCLLVWNLQQSPSHWQYKACTHCIWRWRASIWHERSLTLLCQVIRLVWTFSLCYTVILNLLFVWYGYFLPFLCVIWLFWTFSHPDMPTREKNLWPVYESMWTWCPYMFSMSQYHTIARKPEEAQHRASRSKQPARRAAHGPQRISFLII